MDLIDTFFNGRVLWDALPLLLMGLGTTLSLGILSIVLGLIGGLILALLRLYGPPALSGLWVLYIDLFRAIPILVLLVIVYYALPFVGIRLSPSHPPPPPCRWSVPPTARKSCGPASRRSPAASSRPARRSACPTGA